MANFYTAGFIVACRGPNGGYLIGQRWFWLRCNHEAATN